MRKLKVLDLFAGIGGFSLGLERTGGFETIAFCEIDPYCQKVLAKHWPGVVIHSDIKELGAKDFEGKDKPDIICGGFPCQDISNAGKREGIEGPQSGLWREMYRVICELGPRIVGVENVAALLGRGFERVLADLSAGGYVVEWDCLPLGAFGAHFLRDRVFVLAHRTQPGCGRPQGSRPGPAGAWSEQQFERLLRDQLQLALPAGRNGRISIGVPARMERLHALGNAVSPIQTEWLGQRILAGVETLEVTAP